MTGTIRGSAMDIARGAHHPLDFGIAIGTASVEGSVSRSSFLTTGRIGGSIAFTDSQNPTGTCSVVSWILQPVPGVLGVTAIGRWTSW